MAVLVIAEHDNASVKDATHKTVTAASQIGGDVDILVAGKGIKNAVAQAAKIDGVRAVIGCLLYTSPSPRDLSTSRMPSSA